MSEPVIIPQPSMSIDYTYTSISYNISRLSTGSIVITIQSELQDDFKKLINRGLNTWDHAPPAIKSLGDLIVEGKVLQDYSQQDTSSANPD